MKKLLLLLVLLALNENLLFAQANYSSPGSTQYDFSSVAPSGQVLYYKVISSNEVALVAPYKKNLYGSFVNMNLWPSRICYYPSGLEPQGHVVVPDSVSHGDVIYRVTEFDDGVFSNGVVTYQVDCGYIHDHSTFAFKGCSSLTGVTIPSTLKRIEKNAFAGCVNLDTIVLLSDSLEYIKGQDVVYDSGYYTNRSWVCYHIAPYEPFYSCPTSTFILGDNVHRLPSNLFRGREDIVTMDNKLSNIQYIGNSVFLGCDHLRNVQLGLSCKIVGDSAFAGCSLLHGEFEFPASVESIGSSVLDGCTRITSIKMRGSVPPAITSTTFAQFPDTMPIYIPCGSTMAYYAADNWTRFTNMIEYTEDSIFVETNDITQGTVAIVQRNSCGNNTAIIQATGNTNYHFDHWNDGNTSNPRYVPVTQDTFFTAYFNINLANVSVGCNDTAMGHVSGSGNYIWDSLFTITATPNYGYHFVQWNDGSTQASRQVSVRQNTSYTAMFAPNIYNLVVMQNYSSRGSVSGAGSYNYNTQQLIVATAASGYMFECWTDGNTDNPRMVTLTKDTVFIANFIQSNYTVMTNCNIAHGSVSGGGSYLYGTTAILQAVPNDHYHFTQWSDGSVANPRSLMVTKDTLFTALFALDSVSLTLQMSDAAMGTVSGAGIYLYGAQPYISATPNLGYHFVQWEDGTTINPRRVTLIQDTTFSAIFEANSYLVLLNSNISSCSVSGTGSYLYNTIAALSATSAPHYHFEMWSDGNLNNPRNLLVVSDTLLTAMFAPDSHDVHIRINDSLMGSVSGFGRYAYGTQVLLAGTPNDHYHFVQWGDGLLSPTRQLTLVGDTTLEAIFAIDQHMLSAFSSDTTMGTVEGGGQYDYGATVTLSAAPGQHSHFLYWSDGVTTNPRVIEVTSDLSLIAFFAEDSRYTVAVTCNDPDMGSVAGAGSYYYGDNVTLTATANDHYHFAQWSDGNTQNPRIVQVLTDATYSAIFEPDMYMLTLSANDNSKGAVYGAGEYAYGSSVTITAQAFEGYRFITWSDGDTHSVRVLTIMGDVNLRAEFGNAVGISGIEYDYSVRTANMQITINGVAGRKVEVYDISGRRIAYMDSSNDTELIAVPARGVYMVKVGVVPARKVVVM